MNVRSIAHVASASALVFAAAAPSAAFADSPTLGVNYYTVAESGDPDFNTNPCCSSFYYNEVMPTLGPDGLPVYNPGYGGPTLYDVNAKGELTWWSPTQNSNVVYTGSGTATLPFYNGAFFPNNGQGSSDTNGFQAAVFRGTLVVPQEESVTFTIGADDDAFLALNNNIVSQVGGIHPVSPAPVTTQTLEPGSYALTLFYTDRHVTGAGLQFSVDTANVSISPTPEPSSLVLMALGLLAVGAAEVKRRRSA